MADNRILQIVRPLLGLVLFVVGVAVLVKHGVFSQAEPNTWILLAGMVITFSGLVMISPQGAQLLEQRILPIWDRVRGKVTKDGPETEQQIAEVVDQYQDVVGALEAPPPPDAWYTKLRPVLHQAAQYSVPTYYLDSNYHMVDWNAAFELIFRESRASCAENT
jgi:hypothetical protein